MGQKKTEIDDILVYGYNITRRIVYFGVPSNTVEIAEVEMSDFGLNSVEVAIRIMDRMVFDYPRKSITIKMCSYGGDVYSMLRLADYIQSCTCQIVFEGSGIIASSAVYLMAVCDFRRVSKNATVMIHALSDSDEASFVNLKINHDERVRLHDLMMKILTDNSRMSREFWDDVSSRDLYMNSNECLSLGIIDEIIPYLKRGGLRQKRIKNLNKEINKQSINKLVNKLYQRIKLSTKPKITIQNPIEEKIDETLIVDDAPIEEISGNVLELPVKRVED